MIRRYTKDEKLNALALLVTTRSVPLVSAETGIPERTLRYWLSQKKKRDAALAEKTSEERQIRQEDNQPSPEHLEMEATVAELQAVREELMSHVHRISSHLSSGEDVAQKVLAVARLLDRIMRFDDHISRLIEQRGDRVTRFDFRYPDGSIHLIPPWQNDEWLESHPYPTPAHRPASADDPRIRRALFGDDAGE